MVALWGPATRPTRTHGARPGVPTPRHRSPLFTYVHLVCSAHSPVHVDACAPVCVGGGPWDLLREQPGYLPFSGLLVSKH